MMCSLRVYMFHLRPSAPGRVFQKKTFYTISLLLLTANILPKIQ